MMGKKQELFSYAGKILRVNLSNGAITTEPTENYAKDWLGSSGIAAKILYDEIRPWVTPYDPANKIIFGSGALVGTTAPGANKMSVSTLGPMIGGWASSCSDSYMGGQLKYAGYDSVVIEGKAHSPVYLWIEDDTVEIRDASFLWGKTTWETLEAIREKNNDPGLHTVSIGPAGENLVRGACVIQDRARAFGRCGTGAVMGSKNLKAIVARGTGSVKIADPGRFMQAVTKYQKMFKEAKNVDMQTRYGTLSIFPKKQEVCGIPYKNFQETRLPDEMAEVMHPFATCDKYRVAQVSFPGCAIGGCGRLMHITEGPYEGLTTECNQWEVLGTLQGRLGVYEPTFMVKSNALCDQMGLDVDAAGGAIGWAMECYQRGIITEEDADGLKLEWNNPDVALELIRKIAHREGFGNILAEGCARASEIIGRNSGYYAMHIKGQDLYEPCRGANGWALGTMVSTRGGGHTTGAPVCETTPGLDGAKAKEVYGVDGVDRPQEYEGKARIVTFGEVLQRTNNCLGVCHFNTVYWNLGYIGMPEMAELYSAATGWETSAEDFTRMTMKQVNIEKAFNLRHTDFDRKDDMPTPRDLNEPIPTGDLVGWKLDEEKYNGMLDDYYDLHGWDRETSFPTKKALMDLGLEDVANDLEKIGKLR
ncbi:MAG: aldehyde ferredoxin oxidoreductase family protein [Deltaproteobacteria bacterium]|nr:aldehyde ferredoxin oxidoreductase family protein [Deltaproteobacteria bacterium]MBW2207915.1 aldehyde ferredoxin oxidoreductase family protein [Deltaproteobacteria bacterium]